MTRKKHLPVCVGLLLFIGSLLLANNSQSQQLFIKDFAVWGGQLNCPGAPLVPPPISPGCGVMVGGGSVVNGNVGSYHRVQMNAGANVFGNINCGGTIEFSNGSTAGNITAANADGAAGNIFSAGSSTHITGSMNVNGNIHILTTGGSSVAGPINNDGFTYFGPGAATGNAPVLPTMPVMPTTNVYTCPSVGADVNNQVTADHTITPGAYHDMITQNGGFNVTFHGPGVYVFNNLDLSQGGGRNFIFDFDGQAGDIFIYVCGNVNVGDLDCSIINPTNQTACNIFWETHGAAVDAFSFRIEGGSHFFGTVWAPYAAIKVANGVVVTGHLWSATQVDIEHAATINTCELCKGSISITKELTGDVPANNWAYTSNIPGHANFTIPKGGGTVTFPDVDPGNYTVTEINQNVPGSNPVRQYDVTNTCGLANVATLTVLACENESCTFSNVCKGTIKITKVLVGDAPAQDWSYTSDIPGHLTFTIPKGGGSVTFTDVDPNTYTVTEINQDVPGSSPVRQYVQENTCGTGAVASITVVGCQDQSCTFTNTCKGRITINKTVVGTPPAQDWSFTSDIPGHLAFTIPNIGGTVVFDNVNAGNYTVTEQNQNVPGSNPVRQYTQENTCGTGAVANISVVGCQDKTCTFTNTCRGDILITKHVITDCIDDQDVHTFTFTVTKDGNPFPGFTINASFGTDGSHDIPDLGNGTYVITEQLDPNWLPSTSCADCSATTFKSLTFEITGCGTKTGTFNNSNTGCQQNHCQWCNKAAVLSQVYQNPGGGDPTKTCIVPDILVDVRLPHTADNNVVTASEIGTSNPATWSIQAAIDYMNAHFNDNPFPFANKNELFIGVTAMDGTDPGFCPGTSCSRPPAGDNPTGFENVTVQNKTTARLNIFGCSVTMKPALTNLPVFTVLKGVGKVTILDLHVKGNGNANGGPVQGYWVKGGVDANASKVTLKNARAIGLDVGYQIDDDDVELTGSPEISHNRIGVLINGGGSSLTKLVILRTNNSMMDNSQYGIKMLGSFVELDGNDVAAVGGHPNGLGGIYGSGNSNNIHDNDVDGNTGDGLNLTGNLNIIKQNIFGDKDMGNSGDGIRVNGYGNNIEGNEVYANGGDGIEVSGGLAAAGKQNTIIKNKVGEKSKGNKANGIYVHDDVGNGNTAPIEISQNTTRTNGTAGPTGTTTGIGLSVQSAGHQLEKNVSGGSSDQNNVHCEFSVISGNFNAKDNTANGVTVLPNTLGAAFPNTCQGSAATNNMVMLPDNPAAPVETSMELFPNPTKGRTTVQFISVNTGKYSMNVIDVTGRTVKSESVQAVTGTNLYELDMSRMAKGVYMVSLQNGNEKIMKKVVIQ